MRSVLTRLGELLVGFFKALRAYVGADPHPDAERFHTPRHLVFSTSDFRGAHQCRGALELLGRQQPQRVTHQDRDTIATVERSLGRFDNRLTTTNRKRVRGKTEIRLRLAATSRKEQQLRSRLMIR